MKKYLLIIALVVLNTGHCPERGCAAMGFYWYDRKRAGKHDAARYVLDRIGRRGPQKI